MYYIDESSLEKGEIVGPSLTTTVYTNYNSAQQVPTSRTSYFYLFTFSHFRPIQNGECTSLCVWPLTWNHHAFLNDHNQVVKNLFQQLQGILQKHSEPIFITHIRFHLSIAGIMTQGNKTVDHLVALSLYHL